MESPDIRAPRNSKSVDTSADASTCDAYADEQESDEWNPSDVPRNISELELELEAVRAQAAEVDYQLQQSATVGQFLLTRNEELEQELNLLRQKLATREDADTENNGLRNGDTKFYAMSSAMSEDSSHAAADVALQATLLSRNEELEEQNQDLRERLALAESRNHGRTRVDSEAPQTSGLQIPREQRQRASTSYADDQFNRISEEARLHNRIEELVDQNEALSDEVRRLEMEQREHIAEKRELAAQIELERRNAYTAEQHAKRELAAAIAQRESLEANLAEESSRRRRRTLELDPNKLAELDFGKQSSVLSRQSSGSSGSQDVLRLQCEELQNKVNEMEAKQSEAAKEVSRLELALENTQIHTQNISDQLNEARMEVEMEKQRSVALTQQLQELKLVLEDQRRRNTFADAMASTPSVSDSRSRKGRDFRELMQMHSELVQGPRSRAASAQGGGSIRMLSRGSSADPRGHSAEPAGAARSGSLLSVPNAAAPTGHLLNQHRQSSLELLGNPQSYRKPNGGSKGQRLTLPNSQPLMSVPSMSSRKSDDRWSIVRSNFNTRGARGNLDLRDGESLLQQLSASMEVQIPQPAPEPSGSQHHATENEQASSSDAPQPGSEEALKDFQETSRLLLQSFLSPSTASRPDRVRQKSFDRRVASCKMTEFLPMEAKDGRKKWQCKVSEMILSDSEEESQSSAPRRRLGRGRSPGKPRLPQDSSEDGSTGDEAGTPIDLDSFISGVQLPAHEHRAPLSRFARWWDDFDQKFDQFADSMIESGNTWISSSNSADTLRDGSASTPTSASTASVEVLEEQSWLSSFMGMNSYALPEALQQLADGRKEDPALARHCRKQITLSEVDLPLADFSMNDDPTGSGEEGMKPSIQSTEPEESW